MTTEQDAEIGRMYREKREAEARRDTLEKKLDSFKEQVRAVYNDWDRLEVVNGESLVAPPDLAPSSGLCRPRTRSHARSSSCATVGRPSRTSKPRSGSSTRHGYRR